MTEVFEKIKDLCRKNNIRISALENELGYSHSSLQKATNIPAKRLQEIADYFGVPITYFTKGDENVEEYYIDPKSKELAQEIYDRPELKILFDAARNVSPEDIELIIKMVEKLK